MKQITLSDSQTNMVYLHIFMFFWVFEFIQAVFNYTTIVAVCTWYFSSTNDTRGDFSLSTGFAWCFRYNFGSLALGSFILAVVWIIRIIFEYIDDKMKTAKENNKAV